MAIIKGTKYRPPDDESQLKEASSEKAQSESSQTVRTTPTRQISEKEETPIKRGGLIKGKSSGSAQATSHFTAPATNFLSESVLSTHKLTQAQKKGKILKKEWASILGVGEKKDALDDQIFGDTSDFPEKSDFQRYEDPGFQPAKFPAADAKERVTIPGSQAQQRAPEAEEPVGFAEFKVAEPQPATQVDVEAIIAEAEQKARERADKIIEHAQEEARKLIEQARVYGETAKAEAQKEGFKQGKEDGYKAGLQEFTAYMEEAKNLITQIVREREAILNSIEPELAKLSISIAEKIIGAEIDANKETIINIIKNALSTIKSREEVKIKVCPDDYQYVKQNIDIFAKMVEGVKNLEIVADTRVDRGGCMIETNLGSTDARISVQIGAIEMAFKNLETGAM